MKSPHSQCNGNCEQLAWSSPEVTQICVNLFISIYVHYTMQCPNPRSKRKAYKTNSEMGCHTLSIHHGIIGLTSVAFKSSKCLKLSRVGPSATFASDSTRSKCRADRSDAIFSHTFPVIWLTSPEHALPWSIVAVIPSLSHQWHHSRPLISFWKVYTVKTMDRSSWTLIWLFSLYSSWSHSDCGHNHLHHFQHLSTHITLAIHLETPAASPQM